jgi:acetyltransferase-like isoleucine patch superfamily enzyme
VVTIPFTKLRVSLYRWIGFSIGKNVFIGMKCYMDDVAIDKIIIEDNVTVSYGCYFACHGKKQTHQTIVIKKGAYLGMRCNILSSKKGIVIGENAIIGAASLVNKSVLPNTIAVGIQYV